MSDVRHIPPQPVGLDPEAARDRLCRQTQPSPVETVPVRQAPSRIAAATLVARWPLPPRHRAAMDGYFLDPALSRDEPYALPLGGRVPASGAARLPEAPAAVEVATGARLLSEGAVVPRELCREEADGTVRFPPGVVPPHWNVRRRGEELAAGEVLARPGERLSPWQVALLASAGLAFVPVRRRPTVRVVVTGDELVDAEQAERGTVETHSLVLGDALERLGADVRSVDVVGDDVERLARHVAEPADLRITTGGASVGRHDWVGKVADRIGAEALFSGVAMRPGGPTQAFRLPEGLWLALPGNPMAVALGLDWFVAAWWQAVTGERWAPPEDGAAHLAIAGRGVVTFVRGRTVAGRFVPHPYQSSGSVRTLAETDLWAVVPPTGVAAGDRVRLVGTWLSRGEGVPWSARR